jgi:hypothetical protein
MVKPKTDNTPSAEETTKRLATDAMDHAYDQWWLMVMRQLDMAFTTDEKMLDRIIYRAKAKVWARTTTPMTAAADPGGIVDAVESIPLEPFEIERLRAKAAAQCALRDRLADALDIPRVCDWKSGLRSHQVRRRVHYAGTLLADWGKISKPAFDPYAKRTGMDDPAKQQAADQVAKEWTT